MKSVKQSSQWRRSHVDSDKMAVLNAWHRIDRRTREALRRGSLSELIGGYEVCFLQHFCNVRRPLSYSLGNGIKKQELLKYVAFIEKAQKNLFPTGQE